jgi:RND family efflux transporter MFP subunit
MKLRMLLVSAVLVGTGSAACSSHTPAPGAAQAAVPVTTVTVAETDLAQSFEAGGAVRARTVATVVSRLMADVRAVLVSPGDRVRQGQPLIQLDARELQAQRSRAEAGHVATQQSAELAAADYQAAEAGLALARVTHQRVSDLRAKSSATQHELDQAVAALRGAEARLKVAEARKAEAAAAIDSSSAGATVAKVAASYATLTAPFDGVVTAKMVETGNMANPGQPLMTVEDTRSFRLEVRLDESRAAWVHPGDTVDVRLERSGGDVPMQGRVAEVARTMEPGTHAFLVKIDLPAAPDLRSGMFGRAVFAGATRRGIGVPAEAVGRRGQLAFTYVVDGGNHARMRLLNVSDALTGTVEVRSGLVAGEVIVLNPPASLVDGSLVAPAGARTEDRR